MAVFQHSVVQAAATTSADPVVERGLRFEDGDTAHMTLTPTANGDRTKGTWSFWVKRVKLGSSWTGVFNDNSGANYMVFTTEDQLQVTLYGETTTNYLQIKTTAKFRDTSSWYHFVLQWDSTDSSFSLWVNGTLYNGGWELYHVGWYGSPNGDVFGWGTSGEIIYIGRGNSTSNHGDYVLADFYYLDGTLKSASDFAETDSNGQWVPKATSFTSSEYGAGVHLDFAGGHDSELLLQSDHSEGSTNFEDSSGAGHYGITTSGDPQHTIKVGSPFTGDDRAVLLDGTSGYLEVTNDDHFDFGTGDFTIEWWERIESGQSGYCMEFLVSGSTGSNAWYYDLGLTSSGKRSIYVGTHPDAPEGPNGLTLTGTSDYADGRWHHVAYVRSSGTSYIFVDGEQEASGSPANPASLNQTSNFWIGTISNQADGATFHVFDFRVSDTARYTTGFPPPTSKFDSSTDNTKLLIQPHKDDSSWGDESGNHTIEGEGNLETPAPTASTPYDGVGERSAIYFDGSDYLTVPNSDDFDFGSGDFTIECWVNFDTLSDNPVIFGMWGSSGATSWLLYRNLGNIIWYVNSTNARINASSGMSINTWHHVAVVRDGSTTTAYVDGSSIGTDTSSVTLDDEATPLYIGFNNADSTTDDYLQGYLFDLRITKGEAKDGSKPTAPFESTAVIHPGGDSSAKRNHFDVVNIGMGDVVRDCPESGGNFCTLNPIRPNYTGTMSEGNLKVTGLVGGGGVADSNPTSTFKIPQAGKWYWEVKITDGTHPNYLLIGVATAGGATPSEVGGVTAYNNTTRVSGSGAETGISGDWAVNDVISVAIDRDAETAQFYRNGSAWGNEVDYSGLTAAQISDHWLWVASGTSNESGAAIVVNLGQDGSFAGNHTGTLVTGGGGEWAYAPPSGYKALKTGNLSTTSATTFSYVGNGSTDGPFIYMGYRPSSVTIDSTYTYSDGDYNESEGIDWLANGIKFRMTTNNSNGISYSITAAPKELDFKYGTAR